MVRPGTTIVAAALRPAFGYNPAVLPRELRPHYIGPSDPEIGEMLGTLGLSSLDDLFSHLPKGFRHSGFAMPVFLDYEARADELWRIAQMNRRPVASFLGDGLPHYTTPPIVPFVCGLRELLTAYTSYQPERGQGTLAGLWIYQCLMAQLTGFEAVSASLYDRSTAIFEACNTARRLSAKGKKSTAIVLDSIYPGDREVIETLGRHTSLVIRRVGINPQSGVVDPQEVARLADEVGNDLAAIVFPQVNSLGCLEDVHALTDLCTARGAKSIAVIDPMLLATGGLIPPSLFGAKGQGADIIVGEGQHLAIAPHFGGPGLGIFGIRHNDGDRNSIRQAPGRFVGKGKDLSERDALLLVLSTREQHIRRAKATSNICSNQAFVALLVGAAILARGEEGMRQACRKGHEHARKVARSIDTSRGIHLAFPMTPFFNEFVIKVVGDADKMIEAARREGIHLGVNVLSRIPNGRGNHFILLSFTDRQSDADIQRLIGFLTGQYECREEGHRDPVAVPANLLRNEAVGLLTVGDAELRNYYQALNGQTVGTDGGVFPLGSCTMKYNPNLNEWAAALFAEIHPEAPVADVQGCLHILHQIQECFRAITGLDAVTTQPVAGAQGELVALKMFQAYHADRGQCHRDVILIPKSAHGTNPATAAVAGYKIIEIEADATGKMDLDDLQRKIADHEGRIAGLMVTNPNTSGIFETRFKEAADRVHDAGGLVYIDGANMNAIAGWIDLKKMGVDAVHNNLHKTWSIPHGGGGPGDGMVAVRDILAPYLPGYQVEREGDRSYKLVKPKKSIGSVHRHFGNFAHKVRAYAYLLALGPEGVKKMSAVAVLSARYLYKILSETYSTLPPPSSNDPVMHEFILTLSDELFRSTMDELSDGETKLSAEAVIARMGKLLLDFGHHSPTVGFPQHRGWMIEPTESFTKAELDRFAEIVLEIHRLLRESPRVLRTTPHFTPVDRIQDAEANRKPVLSGTLSALPPVLPNRLSPAELAGLSVGEIARRIEEAARTSSPR